ncbi:hypothetical protein ACHAWC_002644, partial [Mediolabrus comicus]
MNSRGLSISVSLQDLLNSGTLATSTFQLKNDSCSGGGGGGNASADPSQQQQNKQMLNAAKISLILAHEFARYKEVGGSVSSLLLGDFIIQLGYSLPRSLARTRGGYVDNCESALTTQRNVDDLVASPLGGIIELDVSSHDELLDASFKLDGIDFSSHGVGNGGGASTPLGDSTPLPYTTSDSNLTLRNDDLSLRFISEFFDLDRPLPLLQQQQDRQQSSVSGTAFSSEPPREWRQINASDAHKRAQIESLHVIDSTEGFDRVWTILNVDCVPSKNGKVSTATPEQTLGDLIHSIFSGCNLGLTSSLPSFPFESFADIGDVLSARAAKIPRDAKETLFSSLVGACTLPISVCRLLSDLQEDNRKEAASPPISSTGDNSPRMPALSVEDVIQDLQHMSFHPEIYLYDPGTEFYSTKLLFGQRLYGRKDELTHLLGISTKLESAST